MGEKQVIINNFIRRSDKDVYYDNLTEHDYAASEFGMLSKIDKSGIKGEYKFIFHEDIIEYYLQISGQQGISDPWTRILYQYQERDFCYLLSGLSAYTLIPEKKRLFLTLIEDSCNGYYGVLGQIKRLLLEDPLNLDQARNLIEIAMPQKYQALTKADRAAIYNFQGLVFILTGDAESARESLATSMEIWQHPDNDARTIMQLSR
ncbi:MAG: hypothetical protein HKN08_06140 [Gammaproteobacteria bacterium]|nr:hypothetical protein [Gammaproteobacteria bacterium]